MKKKFIFISSLLFSIFSLIFWYSLVFGTFLLNNNITLDSIIWDKVYLDSLKLNNFVVFLSSDLDLSDYLISSNCDIDSKFLWLKEEKYIFNVTFKDLNCNNNYFSLKDKDWKIVNGFDFKIQFFNKRKIYSKYLDYSTNSLKNIKTNLVSDIENLSIYTKYNEELRSNFQDFYTKYREYYELVYKKEVINSILEKRNSKYIIPIIWYKLPNLENKSKLPNWARPYREDYTVWIHQGWDIDAPLWTIVSALDDWIIIRVISDFSKDDLLKINYLDHINYEKNKTIWPKIEERNLTYSEKLKNLDILRWNQVWLKTSKWDIVFYSHLNEVFPNIKEWIIVKSWTNLWTVWKTWVPWDDYSDYHLHFEVHKNPYNENSAWNYEIEDYLKWDWYFKWKSIEYIVEHQWYVFDLK